MRKVTPTKDEATERLLALGWTTRPNTDCLYMVDTKRTTRVKFQARTFRHELLITQDDGTKEWMRLRTFKMVSQKRGEI
jgi:hypothetical protein